MVPYKIIIVIDTMYINSSVDRRTSRKISALYGDHHMYGDDEEGPRLKERLTDACYKFIDIFCVWDCCWAYIRLSEVNLPKGHNQKPIRCFVYFKSLLAL